jgi:hypothetical protein
MQHPDENMQYPDETAETFGRYTCNICNIQMKQMQHPDETYKTYTWNAHAGAELDTHGHPSWEL